MTKDMTLPLGGQKKQWDPPKWMYPIIYNKWKIVIGILIVVLLFGAFSIGHAAMNDADELGFGLRGMLDTIFEFDSINEWVTITGDLEIQAFSNGFKFPIKTSGGSEDLTMGSLVTRFYGFFTSLGLALLMIYWSIGFFDMLSQSNNQIVLEQMLKKVILLILGVVIVKNAKLIVITMLSGVGSLTLKIDAASGYEIGGMVGELEDVILAEEASASWIGRIFIELGYMVRLLIPYAGALVSNIGVKIFAVTRYVEVLIITVLSPIMFADFSTSSGGFTHTNSFRALKIVAALALQGLIIVLGVLLCGMLTAVMIDKSVTITTSNFFDIVIGLLAVQMARLGIAAKSQQIARQVVGLG